MSFRLVTANGTVVEVSKASYPDLFEAGRVGLGVLGIISAVTISTVDLFRMRLDQIPYDLDVLLTALPLLMQQHPRLQWYWTPYTSQATLVLRSPTTEPITPGGCWESARMAAPNGTSCVDLSYKTLTDSRDHYYARPLYTEMEMFVPADRIYDAIADFRAYQEAVKSQHSSAVSLFTGVRYVDADDIWLSPQYARRNAVISMIVLGTKDQTGDPTEFALYTQGLETICTQKYQGRPHWGKQNYATVSTIASTYPQFSAFNALRCALDPQGMFSNDYILQRLGPCAS